MRTSQGLPKSRVFSEFMLWEDKDKGQDGWWRGLGKWDEGTDFVPPITCWTL